LYRRKKNKERERKKDEKKKIETELNKPALNKYVGRAVTDEDENYDNNDVAVVFLGRWKKKKKTSKRGTDIRIRASNRRIQIVLFDILR